jgi:hypothetical protein
MGFEPVTAFMSVTSTRCRGLHQCLYVLLRSLVLVGPAEFLGVRIPRSSLEILRASLWFRRGSLWFMNRLRRRMVVTILVMVLALAASLTALALEHYLPLPRRWWSLVLFIATEGSPAPIAYLGIRRLRRLARDSKAGGRSQEVVDQTG